MKLSKIALAAAALTIGASAFAVPDPLTVAISAGASATRANLITALSQLCTDNSGVPTSLGSGNFRSVVCANSAVTEGALGTYKSKTAANFVKFKGTDFVELRFNTEGSFSAVLLLNGVTPLVRDPETASNSATYPAGSKKVGGLLDLDPVLGFPASTIGSNTLFPVTPVGIAQTFGVAVTGPLYNAMLADQKAAGLIPATCTNSAADMKLPYCMPSIGIAQMATIMADNPFNAAYSNGAGFLAPSLGTAELRYVRRVDVSGTQAAAQNYFAGLPCSRSVGSIVAEPTTDDDVGGLKDALINNIRVMAAPGTGDVLADLVKPGYAIGVISGENVTGTNITGASWRWIRVNGANMAEDAEPSGNLNDATALNGTYDFFFESVYMGGNATGNGFWSTVAAKLNALTAPAGLINSAALTAGYSKGGLACQKPVSN